jgi:Cu/Ag efflux protein CusF
MQKIQRTRFVIAAALSTCALVGTAGAQTPQQDQPSQQPSQQQPSQPPSGSREQGMPSREQPSQQPMGKEGQQGQMGQQGAPTEVMAERKSATATVEKVDMKKREITLKDENGKSVKLSIPKDVKNIQGLKKGDKIDVDYYQSLALSLEKKGAPGEKPSAEETQMTERTPAKLPGGVMAKQMSATVDVVNVDTSNNTITVKTQGGEQDTINVTDPQMQQHLANIKPGDKIHVKYQEAVAIKVMPQGKAAPSKG